MKNKLISIFLLIFPSIIGFSSFLLTRKNIEIYGTLQKPPLSPPAAVFSIAWTILYILMGVAAMLVYLKMDGSSKAYGLILFFVQLVFNFVWSIIFFNQKSYLFAFIWLMALWVLVIMMTMEYLKVSKLACALSIPYILWLTFAAYLNFSVYLLN